MATKPRTPAEIRARLSKSTGSPQVVEKPKAKKPAAPKAKAPPPSSSKAKPKAPAAQGKIPGRPGPAIGARLTPRMHGEIVRLLETGVFLETASAAAGVDVDTVRRWMKEGARELEAQEAGAPPREELEHLARFTRDVRAALVAAENRAVENITSPAWAAEDWRASAWYLERRNPARWGMKITQIVTDELEAFVAALEERLPPDVFAQVLRAAAAAAPGGAAPGARGD